MNKGDRIILEDISGEITAIGTPETIGDHAHTVRWDTGDEMTYAFDPEEWRDAYDFLWIDVGTEQFLDDLYEKNKDNVPWTDAKE